MRGKTFMYKLEPRKIIDFRITEEELIISTNLNIIIVKLDKVEAELKLFLPAENEINLEGIVKFCEDSKWTKIKDSAFNLIDKLNSADGAKHIPVANAMNKTIGTIVNLMKVELIATKMMKK
jgi:hypothetical protein